MASIAVRGPSAHHRTGGQYPVSIQLAPPDGRHVPRRCIQARPATAAGSGADPCAATSITCNRSGNNTDERYSGTPSEKFRLYALHGLRHRVGRSRSRQAAAARLSRNEISRTNVRALDLVAGRDAHVLQSLHHGLQETPTTSLLLFFIGLVGCRCQACSRSKSARLPPSRPQRLRTIGLARCP